MKIYETPVAKICRFEAEDVITTSNLMPGENETDIIFPTSLMSEGMDNRNITQ